MPTVPVLTAPQVQQQTTPQVRMAAPQYVRPSYSPIQAGSFHQQQDIAGDISDAMKSLGSGVGQIMDAMQKEQDEADQLRIDDALNKAKEESLRLQFGDGTDDVENVARQKNSG